MKNGLRLSPLVLALMAACAQVAAADRVSIVTYNANGQIETLDGPRTDVADVTKYTYDGQGRLATVTDALGHMTTYGGYDMYGHAGRIVDPNGVVTTMTYTSEGWLATTTRDANGGAATTSFSYDAVGNVTQSQDADGVVAKYTYDGANRVTDITDGAGNHIHYTLDAAGNKTKEETIDALGTVKRTVSRTYNSLGQLLTVVDALNRTILAFDTADGYDAEGHPTHSADAADVQRKQGYDALNRLVSTIDNYNGTDIATRNTQSVSSYDASDNLEGVSDPDGLNTVYDHDGLGNLTGLHSPDTGSTSYTYDAAGNRIQQTDARGVVNTFSYDALNRAASVSYADAALNVTYAYDEANASTGCANSYPIGRLTRIVEAAVTTVFCYDARGNITQKRQIQGAMTDITSYSYTLAGRLGGMTSPGLTITQYSRDGLGRVSGVSVTPSGGAGQAVVSAISYLPFGPIAGYMLGNGQAITRSYDANYQLTDLTSPAFSLHFARDAMGNIISLGATAGATLATESYTYDPLYRLSAVNDSAGAAIEAYTYSKTGDRLSKSGGGLATGSYGYQSSTHWLTTIGNAARTYDPNGNTTGSAVGGETFGFGYNGRNRLTVVQRNGVTVGTYTYNVLGQRIAKTATLPQTINERFAYDQNSQLIGEYGTNNRDYIWLDDLPVAVVDTTGTVSTMNYVVADGLGTPRVVTDASGVTQWQWPYQGNPFGEQRPVSSSGYTFNLRFPGQYYDIESGQSYNLNRNYEASTGRYHQSDPVGMLAGPSTYGYVSGNPFRKIDPLALDDTYCRIDASWCGWGKGASAVANGSIGLNETAVGALLGEQSEFGIAVDSTPNMCFYTKLCAMAATGVGVAANVSVAGGLGTGALSSGPQMTALITADVGSGLTAGAGVEIDGATGQVSASRGIFGIGGGTYLGAFVCHTQFLCAREPEPKTEKSCR
ncbi:RHS repeat-associated protein [Luteibacter rhizovicinus]|uniref:RHS repeat-associated protein n=1 Tax=Luteibacter rhizovicinus TaxID=242606 RepID=A0A4R3YUR5_9GAMM|nr:RHS repeat-associated core domain-containing protein [Luteibacter rhizovicinus]TCV96351.1 RHS repeat-associated protein [Luteibacter rhizovicinus]